MKIIKSIKYRLIKILSKIFTVRYLNLILNDKFDYSKEFMFNNIKLPYFNHSYNNKRLTERSIEIPIIKYFIDCYNPKNILEVGNVSNYYYTYFKEIIKDKIVVDKYENFDKVINKDIIDFTSNIKFDMIISISTFEHMNTPLTNISYVITNLLSNNGYFIFTFPIGYSKELTLFDLSLILLIILKLRIVKSIKLYYFMKVKEIIWIQTKSYIKNNNKQIIIIEIRK